MSKYRRAAKIDKNQPDIVKVLRSMPGVSVEVGKDDILVGHKGRTYWYEIKSDRAVSKTTGDILSSGIKESQKRLRDEFNGHYRIISTVDEIIKEIAYGESNS